MSTTFSPGSYIIAATGEVRDMPAPFNAPQGSVTLQPDPPSYDADTQQPPAWNGAAWIVADLSADKLAARNALPDAKRYQLKVWLVRNGIALSTVPSIIEAAIPAGPEREEALVRWSDVELVPADHPLVAIVAAGMTPPVTVADVWPQILAIK